MVQSLKKPEDASWRFGYLELVEVRDGRSQGGLVSIAWKRKLGKTEFSKERVAADYRE